MEMAGRMGYCQKKYFFEFSLLDIFDLVESVVILVDEISKKEDNTHMFSMSTIDENICLFFGIAYKIREFREIVKICFVILFFDY